MKKLAALLLAFSVTLSTSCACWNQNEKKTPACVIVDHVIDCSKEAISSMVPHLLPLVAFLLNGANGDPNWQQYLISLETTGLDTVACTAQQVENDLVAQVAGMPAGPDINPDGTEPKLGASTEHVRLKMRAKATTSNFAKWKTARLPPNTTIHLAK